MESSGQKVLMMNVTVKSLSVFVVSVAKLQYFQIQAIKLDSWISPRDYLVHMRDMRGVGTEQKENVLSLTLARNLFPHKT